MATTEELWNDKKPFIITEDGKIYEINQCVVVRLTQKQHERLDQMEPKHIWDEILMKHDWQSVRLGG